MHGQWGRRRDWRRDGRAAWYAVLGILPVTALVAWVALEQDEPRAHEVLVTTALVAHVFVLAAGGLVYWRWRAGLALPGDDASQRGVCGWLTVGLVVTGVHGMVQTAPLVGGSGSSSSDTLLDQLALLAVLCVAAALADRVDVPLDPALLGAGTAAALAALSVLTARGVSGLGPGAGPALTAVTLVLSLFLAWLILSRRYAEPAVRRRLAVSVMALAAGAAVLGLDSSNPGLVALAVAADLIGAMVICLTTQAMLRQVLTEHLDELAALRAALDRVGTGDVGQRELLHELSSTIAGITTASSLRHHIEVPRERRERLDSMVEAELARLQRLIAQHGTVELPAPVGDGDAGSGGDGGFDVDDALADIVLSHQTRGRLVVWETAGLRAQGDPDDLAEMVNVLLENAAQHAPGAKVLLGSHRTPEGVEITCRDDGPGIAVDLAGRIFEAEVRSATTGGHGLGLAIARRLARRLGGDIELQATGTTGTTFVVRLREDEVVTRGLDVVA